MMSRDATVLVVGLGRSGLAAVRLAAAEGLPVRVTDQRPPAELEGMVATLPADVETILGGHPDSCLDSVGEVVVSPGVPGDTPLLGAAQVRGLPLVSEVEFAWRRRRDATLIAVTGSNGKSTVTTLIGDVLRAAGGAVAVGGNLGTAASQLVLDGGFDTWVLEVSSFQTELFHELAPRVGVFLNLSQDHLERHADMECYAAAKRRLFAHQGASDTAVLNADDRASAETPTRAGRRLFSVESRADAWLDGGVLRLGDRTVASVDDLSLGGRHNVANVLAAALAVEAVGVDPDAVGGVVRKFEGLPHRHRTVAEAAGVRWVDDSKATNVGATLAGLAGYPDRSVHLILGGLAKGQDFRLLRPEVERAVVRLYLIGADATAIAAQLGGAAPAEDCGTLDEAVTRARGHARSGQWVLLAPACASFDQFSGFAERGDRFTALARSEPAPCP